MRIVVAEDHHDEASQLLQLLSSLGHEVSVVNNGPHAVRECLEVRPQVVLLDLLLPGLDGFEVARQVRSSSCVGAPQSPVLVAITSLRYAAAEEVARSVGFRFFLRKPYTVEDLRVLLATVSAHGQAAPQQEK